MSVRILSWIAGSLLCVSLVPAASAFDAAEYLQQNCMKCHDTSVYTRSDRKVQSYPALEAQVARCDSMLETKLFPEDLEQLSKYLNDQYYKFSN